VNINVLAIELPAEAADPQATFEVRVQIESGGGREWFDFRVSPLGMPGANIQLIEASESFCETFRHLRAADRHIRRLVGQAVSRGGVSLPQQFAA